MVTKREPKFRSRILRGDFERFSERFGHDWYRLPWIEKSQEDFRLIRFEPRTFPWDMAAALVSQDHAWLANPAKTKFFTGASRDGKPALYLGRSETAIVNERPVVPLGEHWKVSYGPLTRESETWKEIKRHLNFVYETYQSRGIVSPLEVEDMRRADETFDLLNTSYVVYQDAKTEETKLVMRIFDSSWPAPSASDYRLPLERKHPGLILPERLKSGKDARIIEIGRVAAAFDVDEALPTLLRQSSLLLKSRHLDQMDDTMIYIEATGAGRRLYEKIGFEKAFGPTELGKSPEEPARFLLRIRLAELIGKAGKKPNYPNRSRPYER